MAQSVLSVVVEVQPRSADLLRGQILALRDAEEASEPKYERLRRAVPLLHFLSLTVATADAYDPVFVLEANFDGAPGPFWAQLEAALGPELRDMLRCAKPPGSGAADLYAAVTAPGSRAPVAPLLEACTVTPTVFHQGNRGLDRRRIENEAALFLAARPLADAPALRTETAVQIHANLRRSLLPAFPWLAEPAPPRVGEAENLADIARLTAFALLAAAVLFLPGAAAAEIVRTPWLIALLAALAVWLSLRVRDLGTVQGRCSRLSWAVGLFGLALAAVVEWRWLADAPPPSAVHLGLCALFGGGAVAAGLLAWLRLMERADPTQSAPPPDAAALARIARGEDQTAQNHMISIVQVKSGVLRTLLLRAGLTGLGYFLRLTARDGYLASMRTIHFAHWGIIGNGGRLMFHSNFDGSWESYLDDFIEKAHAGLTLAWTSGVGFPSTRFLIQDGATQGRLFKAWARHSMTQSQFWFTAYKDLTVNQIERQARLADGLRKPTLTPTEAAAWTLDL